MVAPRRVAHEQATRFISIERLLQMSVKDCIDVGRQRRRRSAGFVQKTAGFGNVHIQARGDDLYQSEIRECLLGAGRIGRGELHQVLDGSRVGEPIWCHSGNPPYGISVEAIDLARR
jgi:hypothetical protein